MEEINGISKANFLIAYKIVKKLEGGYVPSSVAASIGDRGGETYKGVARNFNPNWAGWKIVDLFKQNYGLKFRQEIKSEELDKLVRQLFKANYWDVLHLDNLNNQSLANLIFDYSINGGQSAASTAIKKTLGIPITSGGYITPLSISKINTSVNKKAIFENLVKLRLESINKRKDSFDQALIDRTKSFFFIEG